MWPWLLISLSSGGAGAAAAADLVVSAQEDIGIATAQADVGTVVAA